MSVNFSPLNISTLQLYPVTLCNAWEFLPGFLQLIKVTKLEVLSQMLPPPTREVEITCGWKQLASDYNEQGPKRLNLFVQAISHNAPSFLLCDSKTETPQICIGFFWVVGNQATQRHFEIRKAVHSSKSCTKRMGVVQARPSRQMWTQATVLSGFPCEEALILSPGGTKNWLLQSSGWHLGVLRRLRHRLPAIHKSRFVA